MLSYLILAYLSTHLSIMHIMLDMINEIFRQQQEHVYWPSKVSILLDTTLNNGWLMVIWLGAWWFKHQQIWDQTWCFLCCEYTGNVLFFFPTEYGISTTSVFCLNPSSWSRLRIVFASSEESLTNDWQQVLWCMFSVGCLAIATWGILYLDPHRSST